MKPSLIQLKSKALQKAQDAYDKAKADLYDTILTDAVEKGLHIGKTLLRNPNTQNPRDWEGKWRILQIQGYIIHQGTMYAKTHNLTVKGIPCKNNRYEIYPINDLFKLKDAQDKLIKMYKEEFNDKTKTKANILDFLPPAFLLDTEVKEEQLSSFDNLPLLKSYSNKSKKTKTFSTDISLLHH